jgi:hypothetical protein
VINTEYMSLISFLREKVKNPADLKKATSIAVGVAVSKFIGLPTSSMSDVSYHYDTLMVHTTHQYLCEFNENSVIDIDLAAQTARSFWLMRYSCANPDADMLTNPTGNLSFVEKIVNAGMFGNPDTLCFLNQHSEAMVTIVNRVQMLLKGHQTT